MLSFKNIKTILNEKLILKKRPAPEGKTIFLIASDATDAKESGNETFKNKDFIKSLGLRWNGLERRWESGALDETQAIDFVKNTISKLNTFNKSTDLDTSVAEFSGENLEDRLNKFVELLKSGVANVVNSKEYKEYNEFKKRFRNYSFSNQILIFLQRRNSTKVGGKNMWYKQFGRKIKTGEKAIMVYAPMQFKQKGEDTGVGQDPTAGQMQKVTRFRLVPIFDISQTEGIPGMEKSMPEDLNWFDDTPLDERMRIIFDAVKQYASENNIKIDIKSEDELGGARGVSKGGTIELVGESLGTLIHEVAHEMLHQKDREKNPESKIKELQAEGVAHSVLSEYNLPVGHSEKYLALWQIDADHISRNFNVIKDTAKTLIEYINNYVESTDKTI